MYEAKHMLEILTPLWSYTEEAFYATDILHLEMRMIFQAHYIDI